MSTGANSFASWLAALSLDAARSDLCPNLEFIPVPALRIMWTEGCAPSSLAVAGFRPARRKASGKLKTRRTNVHTVHTVPASSRYKVMAVPLVRPVGRGIEVVLFD